MTRTERLGRFHRRHGAEIADDRRLLEAAGWRTTLEYRENHVRARDGRLTQLRVVWRAEAEREGWGGEERTVVVAATAATVERVWSRLRTEADLAEVHARDPRDRATVVSL
jgi:hypothetical protein